MTAADRTITITQTVTVNACVSAADVRAALGPPIRPAAAPADPDAWHPVPGKPHLERNGRGQMRTAIAANELANSYLYGHPWPWPQMQPTPLPGGLTSDEEC